MGISLDRAVLISIIVEAVCYGIFTVLFGFALWILAYERSTVISKSLSLILVLMYILATAHLAVDACRILAAFITFRDEPGGPIVYINALSSPTYLLKSIVYTLQTLIGDSCMIYRTFVVWQKKWVIALPLILLVSCAVTGIGTITSFSQVTSSTTEVFQFASWVAAFFVITLATNSMCTALISYRIWSVDRAVRKYRHTASPLKPVLMVVIESGAIYSTTLITLLAVYLSQSWAHFIILDLLTPIIGIVFSMIVIRIALSTASQSRDETVLSTIQYNTQPITRLTQRPHLAVNITTVQEYADQEESGSDHGKQQSSYHRMGIH